MSYSKDFYSILNYASTANIEEGMEFCNLDDKAFEIDFNCKFDTFNLLNLGSPCVGRQKQNLHGTSLCNLITMLL